MADKIMKKINTNSISAESKWPTFYGAPPVENLTRGTFDSSNDEASYLKVLIRPAATPAITWTDESFNRRPGAR